MKTIPNTKYVLFFLTVLSIAILVVACGSDENDTENTVVPGTNDDSVATVFETNQALWNSFDQVDYDFVTSRMCFCPPEFTTAVELTVRDGQITSGEYVADSGLTNSVDLTNHKTIDDLFEIIASAIEQDAHRIEVTYNSEQGYPESIFIDHEEMMADEESIYTVSSLTAVVSE